MRNKAIKNEVLEVLMEMFDKAERFDKVAYYLDKDDVSKAKEIIHGIHNTDEDF